MVQGARHRLDAAPVESVYAKLCGERAGVDVGEVLVFTSPDGINWTLVNRVITEARLGFMWECPDYFELPSAADGSAPALKVLGVCPQGLEGGDWARRNVYQSGYLPVRGDLMGGGRSSASSGSSMPASTSTRPRASRRATAGAFSSPGWACRTSPSTGTAQRSRRAGSTAWAFPAGSPPAKTERCASSRCARSRGCAAPRRLSRASSPSRAM